MSAKRHIVLHILLILLVAASAPLGAETGAPANSTGGSVTLSWTLPSVNEDGTPLTDLAGVRIYYGTSSSQYSHVIDVGLTDTYTIKGLEPGVAYYFNGVAYNAAGIESALTEEAVKFLTAPPGSPSQLRVLE